MRNKQKPLQNQTTFTVLSGENRGMDLAPEFQISTHEALRACQLFVQTTSKTETHKMPIDDIMGKTELNGYLVLAWYQA